MTRLGLEQLDRRDVPATLNSGTLTIMGTNYDDEVAVVQSSSVIWVSHRIYVGGSPVGAPAQAFPASLVDRVVFHALNGDDRFTNSTAVRTTVYAGLGDDWMATGDGSDTFYAGSGDDVVYGGGGNDVIYGESGDDLLRGNDGHDRIYGGTGADFLNGGAGNDFLHAGGADYAVDRLYGGTGADTFRMSFDVDFDGLNLPVADIALDFDDTEGDNWGELPPIPPS